MMYNECNPPSSTKSTRGTITHRLRSPICCLGTNAVVEPESIISQKTPRSPYDWLKSTAQELEIRNRCRRVKKHFKFTCPNHNCLHQRHHIQNYPGDFRYDPFSYALNFDDHVRANEDCSFPDFTARLPASPVTKPRSPTADLISF